MNAWLLALYKRGVSPWLHAVAGSAGACRFQPTCSEYAAIAYGVHGPVRGMVLAAGRLLRCHPLSRGGFDPVPGTGFDRHLRRSQTVKPDGKPAVSRNPMHLP